MIARKSFMIFATLALLVVSALAITSADSQNTADLDQVTIQVKDNLPNPVVRGTTNLARVEIINGDATDSISVAWVNNSATTQTKWANVTGPTSISGGSNATYDALLFVPSSFTGSKNRQLTFNVSNSNGSSKIITATLFVNFSVTPPTPVAGFCRFGEVGDLEITDIDMQNNGEGSDDEWEPLDEIEIEVFVENTDKDDDVDDVQVEIKIEDTAGNDVTNDFEIDDEELNMGDLRDDEEDSVIFQINEVPADLDEGDYRIFIKAYSENDEDIHCADEYKNDKFQSIEYVREENEAVVIRDKDLQEPISAICGMSNVEVSVPVYNIGDDKEDSVLVTLFSKELNVDESAVLSNLRSGKKKDVTFFISIPDSLSKDKYDLEFMTYFQYDEDDGDEDEIIAYDENSDDIDRSFKQRVEIVSCEAPEPTIRAELNSVAEIGVPLVVTVPITNNGAETTFVVSAEGFENWATLDSVTPQRLTLEESETGQVTVTLNPTSAGVQNFNILVIANGETYRQPVSVKIAGDEEEITSLSSVFQGNKAVAYLIIAIVALIILILIIAVVRLSSASRRRRPVKPADF